MKTYDLLPTNSGLANLGYDAMVYGIIPYGHFHCLSGIFHHNGQSGILRFSVDEFNMSENGGITFSGVTLTNTRTLDDLYNGDNQMRLLENNLVFDASTNKLIFASASTLAPFNIDAFPGPSNDVEEGDLWFCSVTNCPNRLFFNSGSGIVNISIGSGILIPKSKTNQTPPKTGDAKVDINFDSDLSTAVNYINLDRFYGYDPTTNPDQITLLSEGLYRCNYHIAFDRNGTNNQLSACYATLDSTEIPHSQSFAYHASTTAGENTCRASFLFNANAGQILRIRGGYGTNSDSLNSFTIFTLANVNASSSPTPRGGVFVQIRRLGPRR